MRRLVRRVVLGPCKIVNEFDPIVEYDDLDVREDWVEPVRLSKKDMDHSMDAVWTNLSRDVAVDNCIQGEYTNLSKDVDKT